MSGGTMEGTFVRVCGDYLEIGYKIHRKVIDGMLQLKVRKGQDHPSSKLSWEDVNSIREEHGNGGVSYAELAKKYGVSSGSIGRIIRRESWVKE